MPPSAPLARGGATRMARDRLDCFGRSPGGTAAEAVHPPPGANQPRHQSALGVPPRKIRRTQPITASLIRPHPTGERRGPQDAERRPITSSKPFQRIFGRFPGREKSELVLVRASPVVRDERGDRGRYLEGSAVERGREGDRAVGENLDDVGDHGPLRRGQAPQQAAHGALLPRRESRQPASDAREARRGAALRGMRPTSSMQLRSCSMKWPMPSDSKSVWVAASEVRGQGLGRFASGGSCGGDLEGPGRLSGPRLAEKGGSGLMVVWEE